MIELKSFQSDSARLIANRYALFCKYRPVRPGTHKPRAFFQALSALTGAGKTPVLAQAVSLMRVFYGVEPIVLWMSKARSVVGQTLANFSAGGKYHEILEGFRVESIQDMEPNMLADGSMPLILMTTTGVFNNKDQVAGHLKIYKADQDIFGDSSPWDRLKERLTSEDHPRRRPLIIVYDEGHNLSEQQTQILGELDADAYFLASATMALPEGFQKNVVQHVTQWVEEIGDFDGLANVRSMDDDGKPDPSLFVTTAIASEKVVDAQLVKRAIQFDGTTAAMERSLDELLDRMNLLRDESKRLGLNIPPKAIYVCKTNINDDGSRDDPKAPFHLRQAPPIRIWRYLVEQGIQTKDIAIYASLDFADGSKPDELNLFSKGENDFDDFSAGNFTHIIFNLGLQEGWDDPACYCAYIDKSMGSTIAVEQIIGRVLRQYDAQHYDSPHLNSAHFFLRVDKESVFDDTISKVQRKLSAEGAPIEITRNFSGKGGGTIKLSPQYCDVDLYEIHVDSEDASARVAEELAKYPVFKEGEESTKGQAKAATRIVDMTNLSSEAKNIEWTPDGATNPVRLRWLMSNAIRERSNRVLALADLGNEKYDVRVQINSPAAALVNDAAERMVGSFFMYSELKYEPTSPFSFGELIVAKNAPAFTHSLYERYAGLNKFELPFAEALDRAKVRWHRNANAGGYSIPLLTPGDTGSFRPDFIVWSGKKIFCLDTKGKHLLSEAILRKLFDITDAETGKVAVQVRLISVGKQTEIGKKASGEGFTVWKMRTGQVLPVHVNSLDKAVYECLK